MTDLTAGKRFDRVSMTWMDAAAYDRLRADREERAFQRKASQGQLCAPMVITDGMPALQSQTDGRLYDSKSNLRREYRRAGVIEVGNDVPTQRPKADKTALRKARRAAIGKALSYAGFGAP